MSVEDDNKEKMRPEDDISLNVPDVQQKMFRRLFDMWQEGRMCDAVIVTKNGSIQVHRLILESVSSYFCLLSVRNAKSHKERSLSRYDLVQYDHDIVMAVLQTMYTGYLQCRESQLAKVTSLCQTLHMTSVVRACQSVRGTHKDGFPTPASLSSVAIETDDSHIGCPRVKETTENNFHSSASLSSVATETDIYIAEQLVGIFNSGKKARIKGSSSAGNTVRVQENVTSVDKDGGSCTSLKERKTPKTSRSSRTKVYKTPSDLGTSPKQVCTRQHAARNSGLSAFTRKRNLNGNESNQSSSPKKKLRPKPAPDLSNKECTRTRSRQSYHRPAAPSSKTPNNNKTETTNFPSPHIEELPCSDLELSHGSMEENPKRTNEKEKDSKKEREISDSCSDSIEVTAGIVHSRGMSEGVGHLLVCAVCGERFTSKHHMQKHNEAFHPELYLCSKCGQGFPTEEVQNVHQQSCDAVPKRGKKFNCVVCNQSFRIQRLLQDHKRTEHPDLLKCDQCGRNFSSVTALDRHQEAHQREPDKHVTCRVCKLMVRQDELENHKRREHPTGDARCQICDQVFVAYTRLIDHNHRKHNVPYDVTKFPLLYCDQESCEFKCVNPRLLNIHKSEVHCERQFHCEKCGKSFKSSKALATHMKTHLAVEDRERFQCDLCVESFLSKAGLKQHTKYQHQNGSKEKFLCHLCPHENNFREGLNTHLLRVHKVEPHKKNTIRRCDQCDFITLAPSALKKHKKRHAGKKENLECEECGKIFHNGSTFGIHVKMHAKVAQQCPHERCSYKTKNPSNMKTHLQCSHGNKEDKKEVCPFCSFRTKLSGNLRKHIAGKHKMTVMTVHTLQQMALKKGSGYPNFREDLGSEAGHGLVTIKGATAGATIGATTRDIVVDTGPTLGTIKEATVGDTIGATTRDIVVDTGPTLGTIKGATVGATIGAKTVDIVMDTIEATTQTKAGGMTGAVAIQTNTVNTKMSNQGVEATEGTLGTGPRLKKSQHDELPEKFDAAVITLSGQKLRTDANDSVGQQQQDFVQIPSSGIQPLGGVSVNTDRGVNTEVASILHRNIPTIIPQEHQLAVSSPSFSNNNDDINNDNNNINNNIPMTVLAVGSPEAPTTVVNIYPSDVLPVQQQNNGPVVCVSKSLDLDPAGQAQVMTSPYSMTSLDLQNMGIIPASITRVVRQSEVSADYQSQESPHSPSTDLVQLQPLGHATQESVDHQGHTEVIGQSSNVHVVHNDTSVLISSVQDCLSHQAQINFHDQT